MTSSVVLCNRLKGSCRLLRRKLMWKDCTLSPQRMQESLVLCYNGC